MTQCHCLFVFVKSR